MAIAGRATGVWHRRENTFYFQMPPGITKAYMEFSGILGHYQFDFDMSQCTGSYLNGEITTMTMRVTDFSWKENFPGATMHGQVLQITCLGD